jgi:hypothetical protein
MVHEIVGRINGQFGTLTYVPIYHLDTSLSFTELCALYAVTDVALVTSLVGGPIFYYGVQGFPSSVLHQISLKLRLTVAREIRTCSVCFAVFFLQLLYMLFCVPQMMSISCTVQQRYHDGTKLSK